LRPEGALYRRRKIGGVAQEQNCFGGQMFVGLQPSKLNETLAPHVDLDLPRHRVIAFRAAVGSFA
jgi:hypothetical protein